MSLRRVLLLVVATAFVSSGCDSLFVDMGDFETRSAEEDYLVEQMSGWVAEALGDSVDLRVEMGEGQCDPTQLVNTAIEVKAIVDDGQSAAVRMGGWVETDTDANNVEELKGTVASATAIFFYYDGTDYGIHGYNNVFYIVANTGCYDQ